MVAVDVTARAAASDPSSASKIPAGGRSEGGEGGFGSALESLEQGNRRMAGERGDRDGHSSFGQKDEGGQDAGQTSRSRIDLSAAALARSRSLAAGQSGQAVARQNDKATADTDTLHAEAPESSRLRSNKSADAAAGTTRRPSREAGRSAGDESETVDARMPEPSEARTPTAELASVLTMLAGGGQADGAAMPKATSMPVRTGGRSSGEENRGERSQMVSATAANELAALSGEPQSVVLPSDQSLSTDERTFRFSSGRGKGASMDMVIGTDRQGLATVETRSGTTGQAETIAVLDARRFLGFGQSVNGAALTAAMSGDPEWAGAMQPGASLSNAAAQSSTGNVVNTLKLQMTPIDLGTVTATLRLVGDELSVQLTVENRAAHKQLTQDSSGILDALRAQGFSVDQVTVSIAPASSVTQPAQQDALGQQAGPGSGQGQGGQPGREQQSSQPGGGSTAGMFENETATDHGAAGTGSARPDHLYV
ncbi:chemotaxis protein MotD [Rhizobium sp. RU35A]|uniref:flagellar hook-length control protein FliK n=1 Tax=Rhizobium sp. RU35A TaxID=1907414 RepID=UPI000955E2C0|nr:flagellar hook-length control protein FliK [Rhizobium sp. RU35A]SIQ02342.1 chemotaxis protein MotD [Rhizobium sp. RU35A]